MEVTGFLQGRLNTSIPKDTLKGCAAQVMSIHGVEVILATASAKKAIACALSFHGWSARSPKDPELTSAKATWQIAQHLWGARTSDGCTRVVSLAP